jgi:hypothetical protein
MFATPIAGKTIREQGRAGAIGVNTLRRLNMAQ